MADVVPGAPGYAPSPFGGGGGGTATIAFTDKENLDQIKAAMDYYGVDPKEQPYLLKAATINAAPVFARIAQARAAKEKAALPPTKAPYDPVREKNALVRDFGAEHPEFANVDPEDAGKIRDALIKQKYAAPKAEKFAVDPTKLKPDEAAFIQGLDPTAANSALLSRREKQSEQAAKLQRTGQLVDRLKAQFPQYSGQIEALRDTPEAIPNIMASLYKQQFEPPKEQKFHIDRSHLPPGLAKYGPFLSDEQIGQLAAADYKSQAGRGGNPPGFKGLTIVQDDRFKRSGLKTGDTVCIKIP